MYTTAVPSTVLIYYKVMKYNIFLRLDKAKLKVRYLV